MTITERVKFIADQLYTGKAPDAWTTIADLLIADQLHQAEQAGYERGIKDAEHEWNLGYSAGFHQAREKAANAAKENAEVAKLFNAGCDCEAIIRTLQPDGDK